MEERTIPGGGAGTIGEDDLLAYVDDQLDLRRRIQVETWLQAHPAAAARVMADLRLRHQMRLEVTSLVPPISAESYAGARRLARRLRWRSMAQRMRRVAAMALVAAGGWVAHQAIVGAGVPIVSASPALPVFAEAAVAAHALWTGMPTDPADGRALMAEAEAEAGVDLPDLPEGWEVLAVAMAPQAQGPTVELAILAPGLGRATLRAAVAEDGFVVEEPSAARIGGTGIATWRYGRQLYALCAEAEPPAVLSAARTLAASLL